MLKERVITAVVLLVVFAALLGFASVSFFSLVLALIVAASAWEWSRLCGVSHEHAQTVFAIMVGAVTLISLNSSLVDTSVATVMLVGLLFWLCVPIQLYLKPGLSDITDVSFAWLIVGLLILPIAAIAIQYMRSYAPSASGWLLLYALGVVWVMDIGAYFSGRRFGKRKLAPLISPGKSWEGVYGGLACAFVLYVLALVIGSWPEGIAFKLFIATVFAAAASVLGDLFESRMKRAASMKDSSQLLPGHGGVLDRFDGVIAALPVFAFFWVWM